MLLGGNNKITKQYSDNFEKSYIEDIEFCALLISQTRFAEAWAVMESLKQESVPLLYNRMLCLKSANENQKALPLLERLLSLIISLPNIQKTSPTVELTNITNKQKVHPTHYAPITFHYVDKLPHFLKDSILRHIIECYQNIGNEAKVVEIGALFSGKGYKDVDEILEKFKK